MIKFIKPLCCKFLGKQKQLLKPEKEISRTFNGNVSARWFSSYILLICSHVMTAKDLPELLADRIIVLTL